MHAGLDRRRTGRRCARARAPCAVAVAAGRLDWLLAPADALQPICEAHRLASSAKDQRLIRDGAALHGRVRCASAPAVASRTMRRSARSRKATLTGCFGSSRTIATPRLTEAGHRRAARHHDGDVRLDRRDDVLGAQTDLGVRAVEHDEPRVLGVAEQVERVQGQPQVLDRRDVERGDQDEDVAVVEGGQDVLGEGRRRVDDDVVVGPLGDPQQLGDRRARDPVGVAGLGRRAAASRPLSWWVTTTLQALLVEVTGHADQVGDRVLRQELQADAHVAEGEVEVDDAAPWPRSRRGRRRGWWRRSSCRPRPWRRRR